MKTKLTTLITISVCAIVFAQTTSIPDINFETKLVNLGIDTNGINGNILNADALTVNTLDISNENISSIAGIEAFVNLISFNCSNNDLTSLPIEANSDLTFLDFSNNQITNVSINQNPLLTTLQAGFNQLASINLSNNSFLEVINCESNLLSGLNVSNTSNLLELNCQGNTITVISLLPASLQKLNASNNILSDLNFNDIAFLQELNIKNNNFPSLELILATSLIELNVENNSMSNLDIRNGNNTNLTSMSAINNPNLFLICVDDTSFSETAAGWQKDATTSYSETCELSLERPLFLDYKPKNPITQSLQIPSRILNIAHSIKIYNSTGQQLYAGLDSSINASGYATGLYFLKIESKTGQQRIYKLVKKN